MTDPLQKKDKPPVILLAIGLALFALGIASAYRYFTNQAISPDPFVYGHVATEMLAGKRLYLQTWQDKPPLAFVFYAVPQFLGFRSYGAQGFFVGLWLVAQGLVFFTFFRRELPVAISCLLFTTLFPVTDWDWVWPSTEHFSNIFITGILLIMYVIVRDRRFTRWQCIGIGILMVIAFHIRQNTILPGLLPVAAIAFADTPNRQKAIGLGLVAAAAAITWLLILLLVMRIGDLHGYFYTVFQYPQAYSQVGLWIDVAKSALMPAPTALPVLLVFFAGMAMIPRFRWYILGSLVLAIFMCLMPKRPFGHYWLSIFPFLTLYIAIGLQRANIGSARAQWAFAAALIFAGAMMMSYRLWATHTSPSYRVFKQTADAVDRVARPDSTLLVCAPMPGDEAIVFTSVVPAANTYCFTFQFRPPYQDLLPKQQGEIFAEYLAQPPDIIAIDAQYLDAARGPDVPGSAVRLVSLLLQRYPYAQVAVSNDYRILQLRR